MPRYLKHKLPVGACLLVHLYLLDTFIQSDLQMDKITPEQLGVLLKNYQRQLGVSGAYNQ